MKKYLTDKTYRAGAYARLSVEDDNKNESISIKNQKEFIREFALKNNIEIYEFYTDDGFSGGNFERPAFQKLLKDIESGIIDCVITKDMSRLGREFIETSNYVFKFFPEHDIRFIAILDNYDSIIDNGVADSLPIKAVFNDFYLKDISRKIKSVRHEMMRQGEFVGGTVPYGYKRSIEKSTKLVLDEYASNIVKRIFEMKEAGMTSSMIARTLTNEGVLPPEVYSCRKRKNSFTTKLWKTGSVDNILKNKIYIGTLIQGMYDRVSLKSKKKRKLPESEWIVVENAVPSLISIDLFQKVNQKQKKINVRHRTYDYLLKGLVVCADCGVTMSVRRVKSQKDEEKVTPIYLCRTYARYRNNVCSMHYFKEEELNQLVLNKIRNVFIKYSNNEMLEKKYETTLCNLDILNEYENMLHKYKTEITMIDKAISNLYKDKVKEIVSSEEFYIIKKDLEKDRKDYLDKILNLEVSIEEAKNRFTNQNQKKKYITEFLKAKNPSKEMLSTLINKIEINEEKKVKIYFNFCLQESS